MSVAVWIITSFIAYIAGMAILVRVTPKLYYRSYDGEMFLGIATLDILGAILAFGAVIVTLALFNGAAGVRILDFLMLVGILIVSISLIRKSLRRPPAGSFRSSLLLVAGYGIFLLLACIYTIIQLLLLK